MDLKFTKNRHGFWLVEEDGIDTDKVKFETLGFIIQDELGTHWNIFENYSGIIEFEELNQIHRFMVKLIAEKQGSSQDMCKCGHEKQWHDFANLQECRVDIAGNPTVNCYCLKFVNAKVSESQGGKK